MKDLLILAKEPGRIVYAVDEPKTLTREDARAFLTSTRIAGNVEDFERAVKDAEEGLAAVVAEIDTKVAEREDYETVTIKEALDEAKARRDLAIKNAQDEYDANVLMLRDRADKLAEDLCKLKEEGLRDANERLNKARKALEDFNRLQLEYTNKKELCTEALAKMDEVVAAEKAKVLPAAEATPRVVNLAANGQVSRRLKF